MIERKIYLLCLEYYVYRTPVLRRTADAFFKDVSPFMLHLGMFVPTIIGQCTPEQQAQWLPRALEMQIIGAYAQVKYLFVFHLIFRKEVIMHNDS